MSSGDFLTGLTAMMHWIGFLVLPVIGALALIQAVIAFVHNRGATQYMVAAFACLLGPALAALGASFAARTPIGGQDQVYNTLLNLTNYLGNVILPLCSAFFVIRGLLALGGVFEHGHRGPGHAMRYFVGAAMCLMVSGMMRLIEALINRGATTTLSLIDLQHGGHLSWLFT